MSKLTLDKTPGHPVVLVVDITRDREGFEYRMTQSITDELRKRTVDLTQNSPVFATDESEYLGAFNSAPTFNCLLLVAHGGGEPKGGRASAVAGPLGRMDWYSLSALTENLRDKFVMLAVCHGYCEDAISAFLTDDSWALSLLASKVSLSSREAIAFFPPFLETLTGSCPQSIDPTQIRYALEVNNILSGNKMEMVSHALPI